MNTLKIYVVSNMKLFSEYIILEADYTERNQKIKDKLINIFYILQLNDVISLSSDKELKTSYNELVKQCKSALHKILVNASKLDKVLNRKFDLLLKNNFDYSGKKATEFDNLTGDIQEKIKTFISKLDGLKSTKNESLNEAEEDYNIELSDKDKEWINNEIDIPINHHTKEEDEIWIKWAVLKLQKQKYIDAEATVPKELLDLIDKAHKKAVEIIKEKEGTKEAADAKVAWKKKQQEDKENTLNNIATSFEKDLIKKDKKEHTSLFANIQNSENEQNNKTSDKSDNIDKLKAELEKIKDVQFDDEDNNFYKIGQRLIVNYEAFKDTMSDDDKKKLDTKIDKLIEDINKLSNTQTTNTEDNKTKDSEEQNNQKEVKQTETKVIESKFITGIKQDIEELQDIEKDSLFSVFNKYATDDIKNEPDGKEYLGLTILTLGAILLKKQDEHNWATQILDITKKDEV